MGLRYNLRCLFKYPYQRIRYGYDERIKWGFDEYFDNMLKPLEEFCREELKDTEAMEFNLERKKVYEKTIEHIKKMKALDWKAMNTTKISHTLKDMEKYEQAKREARIFIAENIEGYWN